MRGKLQRFSYASRMSRVNINVIGIHPIIFASLKIERQYIPSTIVKANAYMGVSLGAPVRTVAVYRCNKNKFDPTLCSWKEYKNTSSFTLYMKRLSDNYDHEFNLI